MSTYTSNEGKKNQRIHKSAVNNLGVLNHIEYNEDLTEPKELIKFYRVNQNSCDAFIGNYLWAANPLSFNDPFDCPLQLWDIESFTNDNLQKILNTKIHNILTKPNDNHRLLIDLTIAATGIISFHEFKESSQDVLWGYYTDQEGFSIKLDTDHLIKEWGEPFKIEYVKTSELKPFSLREIENAGDLFPLFLRWMTQKKDFWQLENEWRFIFPSLKVETLKMDAFSSERIKKYPLTAIKEITLGLKFFDNNNCFQDSDNDLYYVTDSVNHQMQNQILTYLSDHEEIPVTHMYFQQGLKLHPRKCLILKIQDNRVWIRYE